VQSSNSETDNIVFLNKLSSTAECLRYQQCTWHVTMESELSDSIHAREKSHSVHSCYLKQVKIIV